MSPEEHTADLEIRLTYLDDTVEQLNQVIVRQQERIDRLERMFQELRSNQDHLKDALMPDVPDEPPPHY